MMDFSSPLLILAPMAGVSDLPFRKVVSHCSQPSLVVSEMIASEAMVRNIRKTLFRTQDLHKGTAVQLAGNDPHVMAEAARMSVDQGACMIDINMGCPVKKIAVNSEAGAALMKDPLLAQKIFEAVKKAVPVPVTVKMRKGWCETQQNALEIARIAHEEGLTWVTIHGRTRSELFRGKADWHFIAHAHTFLPLPVIGNGDILTEEDAACVLKKASGIMVGRGCYGRPWFLGQIRHFLTTGKISQPLSLSEKKEIILYHFQEILRTYGKEKGILIARKHLGWYSKGHPRAHEFRQKIYESTCPIFIEEEIKNFYSQET